MEKRIAIDQLEPGSYQAVYALEKYLAQSQLTPIHKELIKIRASQLNGCAFCLDMHTKDALKYGETPQRIFLLDAWRETDLFTEEERILLQVTEEVTLISQQGLTTETYEAALKILGENYLAQAIVAVATINVWNRLAVSTHKPVPHTPTVL
ncbi:carboxymuconolactone decarboxylase family protein [Parapedobacter sp. 2B3]|uniref:carboxymuconolactone decarboxylase family protein n=1 Tax=Parapedobacter sp. 2B3 TaxID=3342381 RepID=UPI0035B59130